MRLVTDIQTGSKLVLYALLLAGITGCSIFRATGDTIEAVGEGTGTALVGLASGTGHAIAGTGRAISRAAGTTYQSISDFPDDDQELQF